MDNCGLGNAGSGNLGRMGSASRRSCSVCIRLDRSLLDIFRFKNTHTMCVRAEREGRGERHANSREHLCRARISISGIGWLQTVTGSVSGWATLIRKIVVNIYNFGWGALGTNLCMFSITLLCCTTIKLSCKICRANRCERDGNMRDEMRFASAVRLLDRCRLVVSDE